MDTCRFLFSDESHFLLMLIDAHESIDIEENQTVCNKSTVLMVAVSRSGQDSLVVVGWLFACGRCTEGNLISR